MAIRKILTCTSIACLALGSCATYNEESEFQKSLSKNAPLQSVAGNRKLDPIVVATLELMQNGDYRQASTLVNARLQEDPSNVSLHILNALAYEKLAETGDTGRLDLAVVGYESALNIDPNNLFALRRLGQLKYKKRDYSKAQELFANALLVRPDDSSLLQELAAASYYAYDLNTAEASIKKAVKDNPDDLLAQRSATMIYSALGQFDEANKYFNQYKKLAKDDPDVRLVSNRVNDWKGLYKSGRVHLAQATGQDSQFPAFGQPGQSSTDSTGDEDLAAQVNELPMVGSGGASSSGDGSQDGTTPSDGSGAAGASSETGSSGTTTASSKPQNQQIIVDCYLLRLAETANTSKGNNILENLQVTLSPGGYFFNRTNMTGSSAYTKQQNVAAQNTTPASTGGVEPAMATTLGTLAAPAIGASTLSTANLARGDLNLTSFVGGLTWSGLSYNLNIANVRDNRTEVIARPSLLTFLNKESVFFSGDELVTGLVGSEGGGNLVKYPVGVTLVVTPTEIDSSTNTVSLDISVEGAEFNDPTTVNQLSQTVQVGKTRIDTSAKLKLGETLALGGIYERSEVYQKSGFPGLSDMPVVQYFFSNEVSNTNRRSVVILMTPRSPTKTREDVERALAEAQNPSVEELKTRHSDWFNTSPNLTKILSYLNVDPVIYREFRNTDVLPPSWGEPNNFYKDNVNMIASFLYY